MPSDHDHEGFYPGKWCQSLRDHYSNARQLSQPADHDETRDEQRDTDKNSGRYYLRQRPIRALGDLQDKAAEGQQPAQEDENRTRGPTPAAAQAKPDGQARPGSEWTTTQIACTGSPVLFRYSCGVEESKAIESPGPSS